MFAHMATADPLRQPAMARAQRLSWDERFMRPVAEQVADNLDFFREEFGPLLELLADCPTGRPILAEGTAWLPELLGSLGCSPARARSAIRPGRTRT